MGRTFDGLGLEEVMLHEANFLWKYNLSLHNRSFEILQDTLCRRNLRVGAENSHDGMACAAPNVHENWAIALNVELAEVIKSGQLGSFAKMSETGMESVQAFGMLSHDFVDWRAFLPRLPGIGRIALIIWLFVPLIVKVQVKVVQHQEAFVVYKLKVHSRSWDRSVCLRELCVSILFVVKLTDEACASEHSEKPLFMKRSDSDHVRSRLILTEQ